MVTKEELEKSTLVGRNGNVWFMTSWALVMFVIDGVVYAVEPPPGESKWGYGPTVFLLCLVRAASESRATRRRERAEIASSRASRPRASSSSVARRARRRARASADAEGGTARARSREVYEGTRDDETRESTAREDPRRPRRLTVRVRSKRRADRLVSLGRGVDS